MHLAAALHSTAAAEMMKPYRAAGDPADRIKTLARRSVNRVMNTENVRAVLKLPVTDILTITIN